MESKISFGSFEIPIPSMLRTLTSIVREIKRKKEGSMNKPYKVVNCEYCNTIIELGDGSKEAYNSARIHITEHSSVLLPDRVVKLNKNNSHLLSLAGEYCTADCLINKIKEALYRSIEGAIKRRSSGTNNSTKSSGNSR